LRSVGEAQPSSLAGTGVGGSMAAVEGDVSARRWIRRSAWLLWAATLVVAAVGLALLVWDWSTPVPNGFFGVRGFTGLYAVGFGGVGALLTWRRPGHPVGWIFAAAGMVEALDFATFEYGLAVAAGRGFGAAGAPGYQGRPARTARWRDTTVSSRSGRVPVRPA